MSKTETTVSFYRATVVEKGGKRTRQVDWRQDILNAGKLSIAERTHMDDIYDVRDDEGFLMVGVHRVINTDFMTTIDPAAGSITDIMDSATARDDIQRFAHTTVLAFLPQHNAIAVARGGNSSPRASSAINKFLNRHVPQTEGATWHVSPIPTPSKANELRKVKGVLSFEGRYESQRLLGDPEPGRAGFASHIDEYAKAIGGDLIVDVKVRFAPGSKNSQTAKAVKDLFFRDLPRLMQRNNKVAVRALNDDDSTELLDIVSGTLSSTFTLDQSVSESRTYSALLAGLKSVSVEMQDEVDQVLGG